MLIFDNRKIFEISQKISFFSRFLGWQGRVFQKCNSYFLDGGSIYTKKTFQIFKIFKNFHTITQINENVRII